MLSTSVNGVTASGVPIINSISNTVSTNNLSTSVNGVTGANVQLIGSNNLSLSGTNLTSTVNGVASLAVSLAPLVAAATTNTLSSSTNTLTNTTNGVAATAAIVNSNALSLSGTYLISTINGIASAGIDLSTVAIGNNWSKTGNSGTAPGTNFIGTTDNQDFVVKVNNVEEMRLKTGGNLGINTTTPNSTLEVNGSFALKVVTSNSPNVTLDNTATVYNLTSPANSASITLPAASSCTNRIYIIVNRGSKSKSISSYTDLSGAAVTTMSAGTSIEIISDGSNWLQLR